MSFYQSTEQVCEIMTDLFRRTMNTPAAVHELRNSHLVLRLNIVDPAVILTVDGKSQPPHFSCGPTNQRADLTMHTRMDVIHKVWLSELRLRDAFFGGQIKVEGSTLRAMTLGGLFRQIEATYPQVLRDHGLLARGR